MRKCDQGMEAAWKLGGMWDSWGYSGATCVSKPQPQQGSEHTIKVMQAFIHELRSAVPNGKVWIKVWTALKGLTQGWGGARRGRGDLKRPPQPKRAAQQPSERLWPLV